MALSKFLSSAERVRALPVATGPNPLLTDWLEHRPSLLQGPSVVIGCHQGCEAEWLAQRGLECKAVDSSPRVVLDCCLRYPSSPVRYVHAELASLAPEEAGLVFESYTLQQVPESQRDQAYAAVASLLRPGGSLLAVSRLSDGEPAARELSRFEEFGLQLEFFESIHHPEERLHRQIRALFWRPT
jgi:2-polyprenyl-3-methyl-5-hydroxy-6-metoxy-1,4-benzoquinol methylase